MLSPQGNSFLFDIRHNIQEQLQWLIHHRPDYLVSYPSNLAALAELFIATGTKLPNLRNVSTLGEIISPTHRQLFREAWDVEASDIYSSEELGFMAVQCPIGEHYHIQSEHVLLEVLDEDSLQCKPGALGRVVVTSLNNFAKPLIRYAVGDYAEAGATCSCGRGLPVINRIIGRVRNMFYKPDGQTFWPTSPVLQSGISVRLPKVRCSQYVQKSLEWIEIRVQTDEIYPAEIEQAITEALQRDYGYPYQVTFAYVDSLPSLGRYKYEEFMNELAA
jgi:phenylacetate-CoA ligase